MAEPYPNPPRPSRPVTTTTYDNTALATFLRNLRAHAPNSTQLISFLTLIITISILLFLAGITVTGAFFGLLFCAPLIILTSPIWFPIAAVIFTAVTGFVLFCGFSVTAVASLSWIYRYLRGMNPPGSDRVNYARSRIYDTASHVKDYAREYGGYLQSRVKDAAPGA